MKTKPRPSEDERGFFSLAGSIVAGALCIAIFFFPIGFAFIWLFSSFDTAQSYTTPLAVIASVLTSMSFTLIDVQSSAKIKSSLFALSLLFITIYFTSFSNFEFGSAAATAEPVQELTDAEIMQRDINRVKKRRRNLNLDQECQEIGYSYGRTASAAFNGDYSRRDVVVPAKCRGLEATQRGIRLAQ